MNFSYPLMYSTTVEEIIIIRSHFHIQKPWSIHPTSYNCWRIVAWGRLCAKACGKINSNGLGAKLNLTFTNANKDRGFLRKFKKITFASLLSIKAHEYSNCCSACKIDRFSWRQACYEPQRQFFCCRLRCCHGRYYFHRPQVAALVCIQRGCHPWQFLLAWLTETRVRGDKFEPVESLSET